MLRSVDILRERATRDGHGDGETQKVYIVRICPAFEGLRAMFECILGFDTKLNVKHLHHFTTNPTIDISTHTHGVFGFSKLFHYFCHEIVFFVSSLNIVSKIFTIYPIEILYLLY